jgi:hypothetical protein
MSAMQEESPLAFALAVVFSVGACSAAEPSGRLLTVVGTWKCDPGALEVRAGMVVNPGDVFWLVSKAGRAKAEFILYNGETLSCEGARRCEIPNVAPPKQSLWARLKAQRELPAVAFAITRGDDPEEAVLGYRDGSLDLAAAFQHLAAARYRIRMRNLRKVWEPVEFAFDWTPRAPRPAVVAITPGLYEMEVTTPEDAILGPAAVLIAGLASDAESRRAFEQAMATFDRAQPPLSAVARREFALSVLDALP